VPEGPKVSESGSGMPDQRRRGWHRAQTQGRFASVPRSFRVVGAAVILLMVGGLLVARIPGSADNSTKSGEASCPAEKVTVATTTAMVAPLRRALKDSKCATVVVQATSPEAVARAAASGADVPDYWIPDSSIWIGKVAEATGKQPTQVVPSIAATPVVLVSGSRQAPTTWAAALSGPELVLGDPLADGSAVAPLVLATAGASETDTVMAITGQAQRQGITGAPPMSEQDRLASIDEAGAGYTTATEQGVLASGRDLKASVPQPGTWFLTYPLVRLAEGDRADGLDGTTRWLTALAASDRFRTALQESDFRAPDRHALATGVGDVKEVPLPPAEGVGKLLGAWTALGVPGRILSVIDVSGSMDFVSQGQSRIDLTVGTTRAGLRIFPDSFEVGVWAFSERLGGANQDYRKIVPVRRLDAKVDGKTQRDLINAGLGTLPAITNGGTGLYDTTLAVYRRALETFDPTKANTVLIFTDGANDDPGSISRSQLISRLKKLADPQKPVRIITIGISADADAKALKAIAKATGSFSFIARRPQDIGTAFQQAMVARLRS
jgi:Bacterial extracellular solute-binding protein/von Willebrand factor type A domain